MECVESSFEVIKLGNNYSINVLEVIDSLEKFLGIKAQIQFSQPQPWVVPQNWASLKKVCKLVQYEPPVLVDKGLTIFVLDQKGGKICESL